MRWQRWSTRRLSRAERDVVVQAQGVLCGRGVADLSTARGRDAGWGTLNRLAHGSFADYKQLIASRRDLHPGSWAATAGYLAVEILVAAVDPAELPDLQREVLVPLELQVLAGTATARTPALLAALVTGALNGRRTPHDRP